jgi:sarcosine oxidase subunit gamma
VTAELVARSPLEHRAADLAGAAAATGGRISLAEVPFVAQVDVRVSEDEAARRELLLPLEPNTVLRAGERAALWLGPDEWLVLGPPGTGSALVAEMESALIGAQRSVVDVSANRAWLELAGSGARELLSTGCPIDLHPRAWRPQKCAQTLLGRSQVVLEQFDDTTTRIGVRPSFADYVVDWLLDAGRVPAGT